VGERKQGIVVSRTYRADPDSCVHALKLLLERKAAGTSGGEDARREDLNAPGRFIIPKQR
jgi:hypothetical protein